MNAQNRPRSDAAADLLLGYLRRWCVAQIEKAGAERATVTVRATTLLTLVDWATFGKGLRTIQTKPFAELSKAGKHASAVRWARVRARKAAEAANLPDPDGEKSNNGGG